MPTSYTSIIHDNPDLTFGELALNFTPGMDWAPSTLERKQEVGASYLDAVNRAIAHLTKLLQLSDIEWVREHDEYVADLKVKYEAAFERNQTLRQRFRYWIQVFDSWSLPVDLHPYRNFAREQLRISYENDVLSDKELHGIYTSPYNNWEEFKMQMIEAANVRLEHEHASLSREVKRVVEANRIRRLLLEAIDEYEAKLNV